LPDFYAEENADMPLIVPRAVLRSASIVLAAAATAYFGNAGAQALPQLGHGVNIELWNKEAGSPSQRIDLAKSFGFTFVRMGVPINLWLSDDKRAAQQKALSTLQEAVSRARAIGVKPLVVLFIKGHAEGLSAGHMICGSQEEERQRFRAGLEEVLATLPDDEDVAFEPINEPPGGCSSNGTGTATGSEWASMQQDLYKLVRRTKPHITFVVDGGHFGDLDGLLDLNPTPYVADRRTVMSFHYYEPKFFTHQGLAPTTGMAAKHPAWLFAQHVPWPADDARLAQARTETLHVIDMSSRSDRDQIKGEANAAFDQYREEGSEAHLIQRFGAAANWAAKYHIEPERILVGEVGVARVTHDTTGAPTEGADRYFSKVIDVANSHHFAWAIWDLDGGFAIACGSPPNEVLCPLFRSVPALNH
jgi:hypothetical protein